MSPIEIKEKDLKPLWLRDSATPYIRQVDELLATKGVKFDDLSLTNKFKVSQKLVVACTCCPVRRECTAPVPPSGTTDPKILVVGRNPGRDENKYGIPFSPTAPGGKELDKFLSILGIVRQDAYITNTLMCYTSVPRPDRAPTQSEVTGCSFHKYFELQSIKMPKLILTLGQDALQVFFSYESPSIMRIHGEIYHTNLMGNEVYLIPTLHPGQVLRDPELRKDVTAVLSFARKEIVEKLNV